MTRFTVILLLFIMLPASLSATTGRDLRSRIIIDGYTTDWEDDEWVLDASTRFPERARDSRWGTDNDITRVGVTWDNYNLYLVAPAVTVSSTLMLFLDTMCGGVEDLTHQEFFRRHIEFGGFTPNVLMRADRTTSEVIGGYLDCTRPFNLFESKSYMAVYRQDGVEGGAAEIALPWEIIGGFERSDQGVTVPSGDTVLGILAAITGGAGAGAGDAAPDPSVVLENDSTRIAVLDNHILIELDGDGDGLIDTGVSPRDIAAYALPADVLEDPVRQVLPIKVPLDRKLYFLAEDDTAEFPVTLDPPDYQLPVYVTARIYSSAGYLVRTLVEDEPMMLSADPVIIEWDWKDGGGNLVPAGIYFVAVSGGAGEGTSKNTAKAAFAIAR
ncbi:MAG: hypothetical protein JSW50_09245 [Candidatus Latescibacterota bacterium]|nr:MAG: hypothetical protein JSW50_09245 [Candidatus Latescibacterota bacterium]